MKYAIIDIGSNSIRLTVYRHDEEDNQVYIQFKDKIMAGLAGHVEDGMLTERGIKKACNALKIYKRILGNLNIDRIYPFATASLRNIKNSAEAIAEIRLQTGYEVDVVSGEEEAKLDFIGATQIINIDDGILVDIGGGSTEIVIFQNKEILEAFSMPVGSLNMYKKYVKSLLPTKFERKAIGKEVKKELEKLNLNIEKKYLNMCGVGGTVRATRKLSMEFAQNEKVNKEVDIDDIKSVIKELEGDEKETIDKILQVIPERIHTIMPGIVILNTVTKYFDTQRIYVSSYGVREGYLFKNVL
ncbi:MAG: hypothetical protein WBH44_00430 [Proteocatella sp.]